MRKYNTAFLILLFFTAWFSVPLHAAVTVSLTTVRNEMSLNDTVMIRVIVSGMNNTGNVEIDGLDNFMVEKGGTSSKTSIVNGNYSSQVEYSYYLTPKKIGRFSVGPANIHSNGTEYKSNTIQLNVTGTRKNSATDPVFLEATLSNKTAYIEESINYTLRLYHIPDISDVSLTPPELENLNFKQLKPVQYQSSVNGKSYNVLEVQYLLKAHKAGNYEIYPSRMGMVVRTGRSDPDFNGFFSAAGRSLRVSSNPLRLQILSLPEKNKPTDFQGLVGKFQMTSAITPSSLAAGDSATYTVTVQGRGNLERIPDLALPETFSEENGIKIYPDKPEIKIDESDQSTGEKVLKWAMVPEKDGDYTIPSITLSYFDTELKQYVTKTTGELSFHVTPSDSPAIPSGQYSGGIPGKQNVEQIQEDIFPIHTSRKALENSNIFTPLLFLFLFFIPPVAYGFLAGFLHFSRNEKIRKRMEMDSSSSQFIKNLPEEVPAKILNNELKQYINRRFDRNTGAITPEEIYSILLTGGCSEECAVNLKRLLQKSQDAEYAGQADSMIATKDEIKSLVKIIEKEIRSGRGSGYSRST